MPVVQNTELSPIDGQPAKGVKVFIRVGGVAAATNTGTSSVVAQSRLISDGAGHWSADLIPNSLMAPAGTWYEVVRTYPPSLGGGIYKEWIVVPNSAGPFYFDDLKASEPEAPRLTESELTDHLAHADPHDMYYLKGEVDALVSAGGSGGSITHTSVTDWDTAVTAKRLDQFATPTSDLAMGSRKITGGAAGTSGTDFVIKSQLDSVRAGAKVTVSPTAPTSPATGDLWIKVA